VPYLQKKGKSVRNQKQILMNKNNRLAMRIKVNSQKLKEEREMTILIEILLAVVEKNISAIPPYTLTLSRNIMVSNLPEQHCLQV